MKRIRCAGIVKIDGKYAFMHRSNVKPTPGNPEKPYGEYYVFPGGGLENDETIETATEREILEELGITVKVGKIIFSKENENREENISVCEYVSGKFGTGTGPEFSGDKKYADRGNYEPVLLTPKEIENVRIFPIEFKEKFLEYIKLGIV